MVAHPCWKAADAAFLLNGPAMAFVTACLEKILEALRFWRHRWGLSLRFDTILPAMDVLVRSRTSAKIGSGVRRNRTLSLIAANIEH